MVPDQSSSPLFAPSIQRSGNKNKMPPKRRRRSWNFKFFIDTSGNFVQDAISLCHSDWDFMILFYVPAKKTRR